MSDDEFSGIQKKIIGWILIAVVGGNTGVILLNKQYVVRADPFTGHDADELREDIMAEINTKLRLLKAESMPPVATRRRIWSLEEHTIIDDPSYKRPTMEW